MHRIINFFSSKNIYFSFMQMAIMRIVLVEYFDPFYITSFQGKILLTPFLIKLLFEIDSYSELKVKKPGHSFRWLIRKKNFIQSEKMIHNPISNSTLAENEMWFPEVWFIFLGMMELLLGLYFYCLSWLYCPGKAFQRW